MKDPDATDIHRELEDFQREREKIREIVGRIGGRSAARRNKAINVIFFTAIISLFAADVLRYGLGLPIPLDSLLSLEVGILLVSIKIIWMIHNQTKIEHFQFWILNSIEYRLNGISNRLASMEEKL
jgi:hypothetical protein